MNNTITPDTESIINIVEKIDIGTVSLPEFQRDFEQYVTERSKMT